MIRPPRKSAAQTKKLSREIRKAMVDCDIGYDQLGGSGVGRTWYNRITNPGRMTIEDFVYLCNRLHLSGMVLDDPKVRRDLIK